MSDRFGRSNSDSELVRRALDVPSPPPQGSEADPVVHILPEATVSTTLHLRSSPRSERLLQTVNIDCTSAPKQAPKFWAITPIPPIDLRSNPNSELYF